MVEFVQSFYYLCNINSKNSQLSNSKCSGFAMRVSSHSSRSRSSDVLLLSEQLTTRRVVAIERNEHTCAYFSISAEFKTYLRLKVFCSTLSFTVNEIYLFDEEIWITTLHIYICVKYFSNPFLFVVILHFARVLIFVFHLRIIYFKDY